VAATLPAQGRPLRIGVHYPSGMDYVPVIALCPCPMNWPRPSGRN
jgi:hypothetical protein